MTDALAAVKQAIAGALAADPVLTARTGRIHDHPPASARFPYLTFGTVSGQDWSSDETGGVEILIAVHVWSRAGGSGEVLALTALVRASLHEANLDPAGCRLVSLRVVETRSSYRPEARAHHAALILRALVETE